MPSVTKGALGENNKLGEAPHGPENGVGLQARGARLSLLLWSAEPALRLLTLRLLSLTCHGGLLCSLTQSHPTLCSPPWTRGSSVHGILQARILEWVAISSSRGSSQTRNRTHVSYISCIGRQILYH